MKQSAKVIWKGSGLKGKGYLTVKSQTIRCAPYTFNSKFNNATGTNSDELLAAAHACDFTMKLSFILTEAGHIPEELITTCYIHFDKGQIVSSKLVLLAEVAGIEQTEFDGYVKEANEFCPVTRILNIEVFIEATLYTHANQPLKADN